MQKLGKLYFSLGAHEGEVKVRLGAFQEHYRDMFRWKLYALLLTSFSLCVVTNIIFLWYLHLKHVFANILLMSFMFNLKYMFCICVIVIDQDEVHNIMWSSLSVTCDRSVVFSRYSGFLHQ